MLSSAADNLKLWRNISQVDAIMKKTNKLFYGHSEEPIKIFKLSGGMGMLPSIFEIMIFLEFFVLVLFFLSFGITLFLAPTVCLLKFVSMLSGPDVYVSPCFLFF